jgi:phenylalanyl-tRNA synthetase beta subunit
MKTILVNYIISENNSLIDIPRLVEACKSDKYNVVVNVLDYRQDTHKKESPLDQVPTLVNYESLSFEDLGDIRNYVADLLICDGKDDSAVGLAGVMGDLHSEITDATVNLAIESAWFNPDSVRFAAQRHGLRSEASVRFERGTDPEGWVMAAERFVTILRETCPDIVLHASAAVVRNGHCPQVREVKVSAQQVEKLLGVHVPVEKMLSILDSIGFKPARDGDVITASVPTWRPGRRA